MIDHQLAAQWLAASALHIAQRWGDPPLVRWLCRLSAAHMSIAGRP